MSTPRNTTNSDPFERLLIAMSPAGIEAQEAQGQREMLAATTLPADLNHDSQEDFEALGFTFGDPVPGDPLFREATLPEGWQREGSDHPMWSHITDERGLRRVAIFYKAAFYDRRAFMAIVNVGYELASGFIYGDDETPTIHPDLTEQERAAARVKALSYLADAERHPGIYGDRKPRAEAFLAALDNHEADR